MIKNFVELACNNNYIPKGKHEKYNVKRGLRNSDGSGVVIGLTEIGDVRGYKYSEGDLEPMEGELYYRGYNIRDLISGFQKEGRAGFEETIFLLMFGQLPNMKEYEQFTKLIKSKMTLPNRFNEDMILSAPSKNIMNKLSRSILALYSYDKNPDDLSIENVINQSIGLIAKFPALIAYAYQARQHYYKKKTLHIRIPHKKFSIAENFLNLIRLSTDFSPLEAEILDLALVLHAEHGGGNNSTFATRVVTSTGTDTYSAISAAVGSLKGFKHGGANSSVLSMMKNIKKSIRDWEDKDEISNYLTKIVRKEAFDKTGLIYGIGHAVYTVSDPRAVLFKSKVKELANERGGKWNREIKLYQAVEELAPKVLKKERKLSSEISANVDFYSGFVYKMLGFPEEIYTPVFAMARVAGWCSHRIEELITGGKIIRPAYKNVSKSKKYISIKNRK